MQKSLVAAIVLNWNDADLLAHSVGSLQKQSMASDIIVVDNGSKDNSRETIESFGNSVTPLWNTKNLGFAGGVNTGIRYAMEQGYEYIALLNNDAVADKDWVKQLYSVCSKDQKTGAVTAAMVHTKYKTYDSTGDFYTIWGLAFPRGRGEDVVGQYDQKTDILAASGGASMFSARALEDSGLFDEDFFAYYEDVDLGLRMNLKDWKVKFAPKAKVLHATGSTSGRVKGFTTYQALKNQPLLLIKNIPGSLFWRILPRFVLAHTLFTARALSRGHFMPVLKAHISLLWLVPKKLTERWHIQRGASREGKVQLKSLIVHDLPQNAHALRRLRAVIRKVFPGFV